MYPKHFSYYSNISFTLTSAQIHEKFTYWHLFCHHVSIISPNKKLTKAAIIGQPVASTSFCSHASCSSSSDVYDIILHTSQMQISWAHENTDTCTGALILTNASNDNDVNGKQFCFLFLLKKVPYPHISATKGLTGTLRVRGGGRGGGWFLLVLHVVRAKTIMKSSWKIRVQSKI